MLFRSCQLVSVFNVPIKKLISLIVLIILGLVQASGGLAQVVLDLPTVGQPVELSQPFVPIHLTGVKVYSQNPFRFDFILDPGQRSVNDVSMQAEAQKLIKYFLAAITVPEKDLWVNLSPDEKDRIVPESFGVTEMGRDLLAQDYLLKQFSAALLNPETDLGKTFWHQAGSSSQSLAGKVWIVPAKAVVYEDAKAATAFVIASRLKVMVQQDMNEAFSHTVLPVLEREVNEGAQFAPLRQVYQSLILATWYKKKIRHSVLNRVYADQNKVLGVDIADYQEKQKIYEQYLAALKQGVYNQIKEDWDDINQDLVPRKYFSGGVTMLDVGKDLQITRSLQAASAVEAALGKSKWVVNALLNVSKAAVLSPPDFDVIKQKSQEVVNALTRFVFALTITTSFAQGAVFDPVQFQEDGYSTLAGYLQPGDTAETLIAQLLNYRGTVSENNLKAITATADIVLKDLKQGDLIDDQSSVTQKFRDLKSFDEFRPFLLDPMNEEVAQKIYNYLRVLADNSWVTREERASLITAINDNLVNQINGGIYLPQQAIDLMALINLLESLQELRLDDVVATTSFPVGDKKINIVYVNKDLGFRAYIKGEYVFVSLPRVIGATRLIRQQMALAPQTTIAKVYQKYYQAMSDEAIAIEMIFNDIVAHELGHYDSLKIINSGQVVLYPKPVSREQFEVTQEIPALLAGIAGHKHPGVHFAQLVMISRDENFSGGKRYVPAAKYVVREMLEMLRFNKYLLSIAERNGQDVAKVSSDFNNGLYPAEILDSFILEIDENAVALAAKTIYEEIFGLKYVKYNLDAVPEVVKENIRSRLSNGNFSTDPQPIQRHVEKAGSSLTDFTKGGVDFNPDNLNLEIQNAGQVIKFDLEPKLVEQLKAAPGFSPVVLGIQPLKNPSLFMNEPVGDLSPLR